MDSLSMKEWLSIAIAFAAFGVSAVSAWMSYRRSGKAQQVSIEALYAAKKANEIASEALFQLPIVSVKLVKDPPEFDRASENSEIVLEVSNKSKTPISGSIVKIFPLSGLIYRKEDPDDLVESLPVESIKYEFPEAVLKNGTAHINVAPFLFSVIKSNIGEFECPDSLYSGTFNIVVSPIQEGRQIGVSTRHYGSKDYTIVSIKFIPAVIESLLLDEELANADRRIKVFAGWPDDRWG